MSSRTVLAERLLVVGVLVSVLCVWTVSGVLPRPTGMRVENLACPVVGVDDPQPRFSWLLDLAPRSDDEDRAIELARRGARQEAFQLVVWAAADGVDGGAGPATERPSASRLVWDSGRVRSTEVSHHRYTGKMPLRSLTPYKWQVRCWDEQGEVTEWSDVATFHTGLLPGDSTLNHQRPSVGPLEKSQVASPQWIGGGNLLRKEFTLPTGVVTSASVVISGVGYYELYLNGNKVSKNKLDPGWTHYSKRVLYVTYDITQQLIMSGTNAFGVMLGGGWYRQGEGGEPALYFELRVNMASGQQQSILVSDASWTVGQGPIISDSVYNGEMYDARLEQPGWNIAGFKGNWPNATVVTGPTGMLVAQMIPPIQVMRVLKPISLNEPVSDTHIFDFGQTMSGWCKLRINGPRGTTVYMRYFEVLANDGSGLPTFENLRSAQATDVYILKGDPNGEVYEPRFTYHGFRYLQVVASNFWHPSINATEAHVVYSSVDAIGDIQFYSGETGPAPILNRLQSNIWWGQVSNLMSVPTDCNQRDERLGWMADAQLAAEEALHNFDMGSFYSNWLNLIADDQEQRQVTNVVPNVRFPGRPADPAWGAAYPMVAYWVWKYTGDTDVIRKHYYGIRDWVNWLIEQADASGLKKMYGYFGDWVPPPPVSKASVSFTSSWYMLYNVKMVAEMAAALHGTNASDAITYSKMYDVLSNLFNENFFDSSVPAYDTPLQTSYILPIWLNLVPPSFEPRLILNLLNDIVITQKTHLSTGILGTKYLLPTLSKLGRTDIALELATQTTYPSWAYMWMQKVETPATTLWELWNADHGSPVMDSRNHIMFGSVGDWLYQSLAGIRQAAGSVGYKHILYDPPPAGAILSSGLKGVNASVRWMFGKVASSWSIADNKNSFSFNVSVPSQSVATVNIPIFDYSAFVVTEGGSIVWQNGAFVPGATGIVSGTLEQTMVVFKVLSGNYRFKIVNGLPATHICDVAPQSTMLTLSCPHAHQVISMVSFASFGTATGSSCDTYKKSSCHAGTSTFVIENACLHRNSCQVPVDHALFGDPCPEEAKHLRVVAQCADRRI